MREKIIRAWNKKKKRMLPFTSIWKCNFILYDPTYNYIIMDYTGIKDKNGKRIFEGDIVKQYDKANESIWTAEIVFSQCCFMCQNINDDSDLTYLDEFYYEFEVIGNIFE